MKTLPLLALAALLAGATPAFAESTARASGALAMRAGPGDFYGVVDRLEKNERVYLDQCTRGARWCHAIPVDGGRAGWVPGSYLIGSAAKNAVTPFEFSFNPLWPRGAMFAR